MLATWDGIPAWLGLSQCKSILEVIVELLKFQKDFINQALRPDISICAMSLPRGNGKSTLAGWLACADHGPDRPDVQGGFGVGA